MNDPTTIPELDDTGEIPVLTDVIGEAAPKSRSANPRSLQTTLVAEVSKLAESLLHQAAKDIEATLYENVLDRLRAQLPEIVDRVLREQTRGGAEEPSGEG